MIVACVIMIGNLLFNYSNQENGFFSGKMAELLWKGVGTDGIWWIRSFSGLPMPIFIVLGLSYRQVVMAEAATSVCLD